MFMLYSRRRPGWQIFGANVNDSLAGLTRLCRKFTVVGKKMYNNRIVCDSSNFINIAGQEITKFTHM